MDISKLHLVNFLSYKEETFEFKDMNGLILITGINDENGSSNESNGAGKSSIFDAIIWAAFGRVRGIFDKELVKDDVIRIEENEQRANHCSVEIWFKLDGNEYKIKRKRKLNGNTVVDFFAKSKKDWKSLSLSAGVNKRTGKRESSLSRTENRIADVINCNCDLFINSVLFEQGNTNTFATSSKGDRENLFKDVLFLNKWYDYAQIGKTKLKQMKYEISNAEAILKEYDDITTLKENKKTYQDELNTEIKDIKTAKFNLIRCNKKIEDLNIKFLKIDSCKKEISELEEKYNDNASQYNKLQNRMDGHQDDLVYYNNELEKYSRLIKVNNDDILVLSSDIEDLTEKIIKVNKKELKDYQEHRYDITTKKAELTGSIQLIKKEKENVKVVSCDVPGCKLNTPEKIEKRKKEFNGKIFKLNFQYSKIIKDIKSVTDKIDTIAINISENDKIDDSISEIQQSILKLKEENPALKLKQERTNDEIKNLKICISNDSKNLKKLNTDVKNIEKKIESYRDDIAEYDNVKSALSNVKRTKVEYDNQIEHSVVNKTNLTNDIQKIDDTIKKVNSLFKKFKDLGDKKNIAEFSINLLSKDIPHILVESAIPEIEDYTNSYLDRLSNGKMSLEFLTERELGSKDSDGNKMKSDTMELMLTLNGKRAKYALYSGGEKTRADIAIHLGYSTFLLNRSGHRLENLFLDEVASALDEEGKQTFVSILHELHKDFGFTKIFLISQDSRLKGMIDQQLTIIKTDEGSKCRQY